MKKLIIFGLILSLVLISGCVKSQEAGVDKGFGVDKNSPLYVVYQFKKALEEKDTDAILKYLVVTDEQATRDHFNNPNMQDAWAYVTGCLEKVTVLKQSDNYAVLQGKGPECPDGKFEITLIKQAGEWKISGF